MAQWGFRTGFERLATTTWSWKVCQTRSFRGSKSRNKVSVGEPAEGSLPLVVDYGLPWFYSFNPWFLSTFVSLVGQPAIGPFQTTFVVEISVWNFELLQLSTTDLLVLASMKNAAKCDK
jgi:hypothetical protein